MIIYLIISAIISIVLTNRFFNEYKGTKVNFKRVLVTFITLLFLWPIYYLSKIL